MARTADPRVLRIVDYFETLSPAGLQHLDEYYSTDAGFKDPFSKVQGIAAIRAVYAHMFAALDSPRFAVHDIVGSGDQCFLTWDLHFRFRGSAGAADQVIHGVSHLRLAPHGRISDHRDYWDAAEELYEKLPAVGALMRWLKRRASA